MFEQIKNVIERFDRILIHRHSRPDGDAMGSQIGLRELLRHLRNEEYDPSPTLGYRILMR